MKVLCEHYTKCNLLDGFEKQKDSCAHTHPHNNIPSCSESECGWLSYHLGYSTNVMCTTQALNQLVRKQKLKEINESR